MLIRTIDRAHPRSRGENRTPAGNGFASSGSSPLTRGKRECQHRPGERAGLIPAHAGKSPPRRQGGTQAAAHPRSRGENACSRPARRAGRGSSPLTRGKLHLRREAITGHGLIPAHAGKTWRMSSTRSSVRGSSPLTRGKRPDRLQRREQGGLIPAHAGKTVDSASAIPACWAHPRSRGENAHARASASWPASSSPLTRGKPYRRIDGSTSPGLIPAHAGKTAFRGWSIQRHWAHPRSRGENDYFPTGATMREGSSPLTRGKLLHCQCIFTPAGLIPAHAGKTPHSEM